MIKIQTSKPVELLKTFDKEEFKQFGKFLKSGFIANSPLMEAMLEWFTKYYPKFDHSKFTISQLSEKLFPQDQTFREQKIRKKLSEFSKLLLSFISIQELNKNEILQETLQANYLLQKNSYHDFFKLRHGTLRRIEGHPVRDSNYHLEQSKIREQLYTYSFKTTFKPEIDYLYQASDHLDRFYYLKKLEHLSAKTSLNQIFKEDDKLPLNQIDLKNILDQYGDDPVFKLYLQIIELKSGKTNTTLFNTIYRYFKTNVGTFSDFQQKFIFFQILNYTIEQVKHNKPTYLKKQFDLYTFGLEQDLFLEGSFISDATFLNIGFSLTLNKAFDLVDQLINKYGQKLAPHDRERAITLIKSFSAFHKGQYQIAYNLIINADESDLHYKLRIKLLSIRCLYHIQLKNNSYLPTLESKIKSFENYILREKQLNATTKSSYSNLTKALKKVLLFNKTTPTKKDQTTLIEQINAYDVIIAKGWLLDIIKTVR